MKGLRIDKNNKAIEADITPIHKEPTAEGLIFKYKAELQNSDYKIIKSIEAMLTNKQPPYNTEALIAHRDQLRAMINDLESSTR